MLILQYESVIIEFQKLAHKKVRCGRIFQAVMQHWCLVWHHSTSWSLKPKQQLKHLCYHIDTCTICHSEASYQVLLVHMHLQVGLIWRTHTLIDNFIFSFCIQTVFWRGKWENNPSLSLRICHGFQFLFRFGVIQFLISTARYPCGSHIDVLDWCWVFCYLSLLNL